MKLLRETIRRLILLELDSCDGSVRTSLWNEYIATPLQIINVRNQ